MARGRQHEWAEQIRLARLLDKWLDPRCCCWTATEGVAPNAAVGAYRRRRGMRAGIPDILIWFCGRAVAIELKSRRGLCTRTQRETRLALNNAGVAWFVCRSAIAAMAALYDLGVPFRELARADGRRERWRQPLLPDWEIAKTDPHERRPAAPAYGVPGAAERSELLAPPDDPGAALPAGATMVSAWPASAPPAAGDTWRDWRTSAVSGTPPSAA